MAEQVLIKKNQAIEVMELNMAEEYNGILA